MNYDCKWHRWFRFEKWEVCPYCEMEKHDTRQFIKAGLIIITPVLILGLFGYLIK